MKQELISLLQRDEDAICDAWMERLSETARLAGQKMSQHALTPVRGVLHDVIHALEGGTTLAGDETRRPTAAPHPQVAAWQINLTYAIEVLLTGEVVIRNWAYVYLDLSDRQLTEVFEQVNRAFHQLLRTYTLHYCQECHQMFLGSHAAESY